MTLKELFWPWGALAAQKRVTDFYQKVAQLSDSAADQYRDRLHGFYDAIPNLHYRDPKTGRLGKKGELPANLIGND